MKRSWHTRRMETAILAALCAFAAPAVAAPSGAMTETIELRTTIPSPSGFYSTMTVTNRALLAVTPGSRVGIGTTNPTATLDVNGAVRINGPVRIGPFNPSDEDSDALKNAPDGSMYVRTNTGGPAYPPKIRVKKTGVWQDVIAASQFTTVANPPPPSPGFTGHHNITPVITAYCPGGTIMISGGCKGEDICSDADWSAHGGYPTPADNGWTCQHWHCNRTTAYVRCFRP